MGNRQKTASIGAKKDKNNCCCCMISCCRCCCRSDSLKSGMDGCGLADDEAHIQALSSQQPEVDLTSQFERQSHGQSCGKCCKNVTAFIFSHIGLCCLVVAYSIMGGFLFQWLESDSEVTERSNVVKVRSKHLTQLWNATEFYNVLHEEKWKKEADVIMRAFQDSIFVAIKEKGWDGREENTQEMQWSFAGSLLYSITVITTIGYGHIAPKTEMGRLATMFYALVGIPLTLLCLANIGSFFGNCFRFLYKHLCNGLVWLCCPNHYRQPKATTTTYYTTTDVGEEEAMAASMVGKQNAKGKNGKASNNGKKKGDFNNGTKTAAQLNADQKFAPSSAPSSHEPPDATEPLRQRDSSGDVDRDTPHPYFPCDGGVLVVPPRVHAKRKKRKKTLKEEVRVPMLVSLMIIALYIFGGAVLFSVWEKDWDYLIGSYFCFITLSTIGFGDYVFGTGMEWNNNQKMIICAFYLFFGLSIIAMCFDLMQEEVRAKCAWLGTKLGLIDEDDEDNEDKDDNKK